MISEDTCQKYWTLSCNYPDWFLVFILTMQSQYSSVPQSGCAAPASMTKHIYGIDNVFIRFDDNDGLYDAGQTLSGKIVVIVKSTTHFGGIRLLISGNMMIKWMEVEAGSYIPFEEHEILLNEKIKVFNPDRKVDPNSMWIFPGKHEYQFSYRLPTNLPYSLDGSKYGRIEYKSKAEVIVTPLRKVESLEEEFFIHSRSDEETEQELEKLEDTLPKENVEYGSLGGSCFVKKSRAEVYLKLQKSVYKQGQKIRSMIEVAVEPGKCPLEGLTLLLVQEMVYTCNHNSEEESRKKEVLVVGECTKEETINPGEKKTFDDLYLLIEKNLPVSGFPHCEYIDVGYFVHAVAKVGPQPNYYLPGPEFFQHWNRETLAQIRPNFFVLFCVFS